MPLSFFRLAQFGPNRLGGVCSGLSYWLGIPAWIVRLITAAGFFAVPYAMLGYLALCIFVPAWKSAPAGFESRTGLAA